MENFWRIILELNVKELAFIILLNIFFCFQVKEVLKSLTDEANRNHPEKEIKTEIR